MGNKKIVSAITLVFIVVSLVALVQVASCTEANPDWVYVTTITGNKSQDINIDELVPSQFHWGVRGTYTATGDATLVLYYLHRSGGVNSNNDERTNIWKFDFEPSRNETSYGNGPLRIAASNVINYTLNIYYDANLVDATPSPRTFTQSTLGFSVWHICCRDANCSNSNNCNYFPPIC